MTESPTPAALNALREALAARYRIERKVGEGGMATVYLAHDVRHDRRVALKVLRPELAAVVGADRFLAEIRTTANLQHPHILPLFDSGEANGLVYYVMPYVEGESLEARLARERQLPVDEAVRIAVGVANALQYAHEQGVIHRDVKPANILISRREPLVADFGIALAVSQAGGGRITETGLSLGTPHYMSPEQATGERTVDIRSDVYALGCVLYEMLAGEPPYVGPTAQSVLAKILTEEPKRVTLTRRTVPPHVDAAVAKALEKLPADRFESAEAFARALADPGFRHAPHAGASTGFGATHAASGSADGTPHSAARGRLRNALWAASLVITAVAATLLTRRMAEPATLEPATVRFTHVLAEDMEFPTAGATALAVSSNGGSLVFVANGRLYVRALDELDAHPIPGSEEPGGIVSPFFSPDGRWIGYVAGPPRPGAPGALKKIGVEGGSPQVLTELRSLPFGQSWSPDGTILFEQRSGINRISENGGEPELLVRADSGAMFQGPRILPGGEHLIFTVAQRSLPSDTRWYQSEIVVQSLRTGERRSLVTGSDATYLASGHIVFALETTLMAVPFDARRLEVTGSPVLVGSNLQRGNSSMGGGNYGVSESGVLAWVQGDTTALGERSLVWVDRSGRAEAVPRLPRRPWVFPRISPDGQRVAAGIEGDLWVYDFLRGGGLRLTHEGGSRPSWSPDGVWLAYLSDRSGNGDAWVQPSDGSGAARRLTSGQVPTHPDDWAPNGGALLLHQHRSSIDAGVVPISDTASVPSFILTADYDEDTPVFSPDGRWIAYASDESGQREIYLTHYPGPGGRYPVSSGGGREPVWAANGELFYRSLDGRRMMATRVTTTPELHFEEPQELFRVTFTDPPNPSQAPRANYDVTAEGQRFLMVGSDPDRPPPRPRINVVLNWLHELGARVP